MTVVVKVRWEVLEYSLKLRSIFKSGETFKEFYLDIKTESPLQATA